MTGKSIETGKKLCPLTISDWIVFLTAEPTMHGRMKLKVTMTQTFLVCLLSVTIYVASYHEYSNSFWTWIYVIIVVAVIYRIPKVIIWASKEEYENSETIKEIISGKLTDSDKIRKRWEKNHDSPENAEELLKICENQIETRWKIVKFLTLTWYSFTNNFKAITKNIHFDTPDASETEKFIAVCENRRERAKILLSEIAPVLGFVVIAMTVMVSVVPKPDMVDGGCYEMLKAILSTPLYGPILILLFAGFVFLFAMLAHYRVHVHAWTAFKEGAILRKPLGEGKTS